MAVIRDPARLDMSHPLLSATTGDVMDPASVAQAATGHDVVISAIGPGYQGGDPQMLVGAAHSLIDGLSRAGVHRLLVLGGAGSLEVSPGVQRLDTPDFPPEYKPVALAHRDALAVYRQADLDWAVMSPPDWIAPKERTGRYRTTSDQMIYDDQGKSYISAENAAVALLDEVEHPKFTRQRFAVGN